MSSLDTAGKLADEAVPVNGTVKRFDPVKGYGFVVPKEGSVDILVHDSTLRRGGTIFCIPLRRLNALSLNVQKGCRPTASL